MKSKKDQPERLPNQEILITNFVPDFHKEAPKNVAEEQKNLEMMFEFT